MSYLCTRKTKRTNAGAVVQLVRILACHARGRGFESRPHRKEESFETLLFCLPSGPLPQPSPVWEGVITTDSWPHRQYIILPALGRGKGGGSEAEIEIVEGERTFCTARQVGYYFNMYRNKPVHFPKEFLDYYESI